MTTHAAATGAVAVFIGGPVDRQRATLARTPQTVAVAGLLYERLDDPDTGEWLGGYFYPQPPPSVREGER